MDLPCFLKVFSLGPEKAQLPLKFENATSAYREDDGDGVRRDAECLGTHSPTPTRSVDTTPTSKIPIQSQFPTLK